MKEQIVKMKLVDIKPNTKNPRIIKDEKFNKLVKSIKDFPEMLEIRPIVIDEDNVVLGGNMRLKAAKSAGLLEIPVIKVSNLSEDKKSEFMIKDNANFGDWDWDILQTEWNINDITEWGLDINIFDAEYLDDELSMNFEQSNDNTENIGINEIKDKNLINISLTVEKEIYDEKINEEIELFLKKYPKTICKIQSIVN